MLKRLRAWWRNRNRPRLHPCYNCFEMMRANGNGICDTCEDALFSTTDPHEFNRRFAARLPHDN